MTENLMYGVPTVKKIFYIFLTTLAFHFSNIHAQIDIEDVGSENITPKAIENGSDGPFLIKGNIDVLGKAKFRKSHDLHNLRFATGQVEFNFVYYYEPCYKEGASVTLLYDRTRLDWKFNPFFNQKDFDNISVLLGGFTERLNNWQWRAQVSINFENLKHWDFEDYMNYDFILWGRYEYCKNFGIHIGFLAQTGMKIDRVYPIFGFDWQYDRNWKINAVFPVNISLIYIIDQTWSVALASRFLDQRNRVGKNEYLTEGVWHYLTGGAEFGLNYNPTKWISANVHVGMNFGGHLTIASRHYHHRHRLRLDSAPYAGAEVAINF